MLTRNIIVLGAATAAVLVALLSLAVHSRMERSQEEAQLEALAAQGKNLAAAQAADATPPPVEGEVYYDEDEAELDEADRAAKDAEALAKLPAWAREFSALSKEERTQFMISFSAAKAAYGRESWAECVTLLNECEIIFDGNPNLWNLRSCALLELANYDEAEVYIRRALDYQADDTIALLNQSNLQTGRNQHAEAIKTLEKLRSKVRAEGAMDQLDLFTFRQLLCHLMLRQEMEARNLVAQVTPMCDSPLYYCSQAAFATYRGNSQEARRALASATRIFSGTPMLEAYLKCLQRCGLQGKYVKEEESLT